MADYVYVTSNPYQHSALSGSMSQGAKRNAINWTREQTKEYKGPFRLVEDHGCNYYLIPENLISHFYCYTDQLLRHSYDDELFTRFLDEYSKYMLEDELDSYNFYLKPE